jgi:hypothetical protein
MSDVNQSNYTDFEIRGEALQQMQRLGLSPDQVKGIVNRPNRTRQGDAPGEIVAMHEQVGQRVEITHMANKRIGTAQDGVPAQMSTCIMNVEIKTGPEIEPHPTITKLRAMGRIL